MIYAIIGFLLACSSIGLIGFLLKKFKAEIKAENQEILNNFLQTLPQLSADQIEFKTKIDVQWKQVLENQAQQFRKDLADRNEFFKDLTKQEQEKFEKQLQTEFDKACKSINFSVVEYEKTIKKRRRKAAKQGVPQSKIYPTLDQF